MWKTSSWAAVALMLVTLSSAARADDVLAPDAAATDVAAQRVMEQARRAMHDAMLEHAAPPPVASEMPAHAVGADARMHGDAAEHIAQRHAVMQGERHRDRHGDPASHGSRDGMGGMSGHEAGAGAGACDDAAGSMRDMERHGGTMGGDRGGTPGTGTGMDPHAGPGHMGTAR